MSSEAADAVFSLRMQWYTLYMIWQIIYWFSIIIITAGSAIVASKWRRVENIRDQIALLVAITSALHAIIDPGQRANSYRLAWVGMNLAYFKEMSLPEATFKAIAQGEEIISLQAAPKTKP
ncbi:hypothetical protein [Methylobacterium variabile]|jgi:hypothetical protein|uniref:hypothetical protein n=1 Tax=Methylobacterium variabile TaxID=298794 RepID=UPI0012EE6556|nr:hypothetical protein [Methylobacterium variabile]